MEPSNMLVMRLVNIMESVLLLLDQFLLSLLSKCCMCYSTCEAEFLMVFLMMVYYLLVVNSA